MLFLFYRNGVFKPAAASLISTEDIVGNIVYCTAETANEKRNRDYSSGYGATFRRTQGG
jgi:hypothetical protein